MIQETRWMRWLERNSPSVAGMLIFSLVVVLCTGCFGSFPLTKSIYNYNDTAIDNKVGKTVLFWVFVIIPVYGIAMIGDALIFNLIEFWTGNAVDMSSVHYPDGSMEIFAPGSTQDEAVMSVHLADGTEEQITFVRVSDSEFRVLDSREKLVGHVSRNEQGDIYLKDAENRTVRMLTAEDLNEYRSVQG